MKKKIRDLASMPIQTKLLYFNILARMASIDGEINHLEMTELYRLMGKFKLLKEKRLALLDEIDDNQGKAIEMCKSLLEGLNDQERNIVRFSLMKDLIIIMNADYYETSEEKALLYQIKVFFKITEEQMEFFIQEYNQDRSFSEEEIEVSKQKSKLKERISVATALGIPLASLYITEVIKNNKSCFLQRFNKRLTNTDYFKAIGLGIISYEMVRWLMNYKYNETLKLKKYLAKESRKIQERALIYLSKDLAYFQRELQNINNDKAKVERLNKRILLLQKTVAALKNAKPQLV